MLIPKLERDSPVPIYRQICESVILVADGGTLAPGERLPPTRVLARALGVHRSTVVRAYSELWALGYLESRPGSLLDGPSPGARPHQDRSRPGVRLIDWEAAATPAARRRPRADGAPDAGPGSPPRDPTSSTSRDWRPTAAWLPHEAFRRCLKAVLVEQGPRAPRLRRLGRLPPAAGDDRPPAAHPRHRRSGPTRW